MTNGNGTYEDLPPAREAVVEQGLRIQQATAAERDRLERLLAERDTRIAELKAMLEVAEVAVTQLESRVASSTLVRDEAVARRAEVETVLASMLALGRAFSIQSNPLITGEGDHEQNPRDRVPVVLGGDTEQYAAVGGGGRGPQRPLPEPRRG